MREISHHGNSDRVCGFLPILLIDFSRGRAFGEERVRELFRLGRRANRFSCLIYHQSKQVGLLISGQGDFFV